MANEIQIPQRNPQYVAPVTPPADLIQALYNRPKPGEVAANALGQGVSGLLDQYYKQKQLQAGAFEAGGPYLMNLLYGRRQPSAAPQQPQTSVSVPSNGAATPDTSAQTLQGQPAQPPQGQSQVPETIQATLNHPVLGPAIASNPDFQSHLNMIRGIQNEMDQANQLYGSSKYGTNQQKYLGDRLAAEKAAMEAQVAPVAYQKTVGELNMQPTESAQKKQALANAQQQIPMEIKKTVAGEVSKQSQDTQNITQLKTLAGNLGKALEGHNPGLFGNQAGNLYQLTGGRVGDASAAAIQNAANPLATALNTELARRFNSGEVALLSQSLIPQPKDTPQFAQQKLQNLNRLLDSMASGNEANVKNVAAAITSGSIPSIGRTSSQATQSPAQIPQGRVTVKSPTGQVGHIPASQLKEALAEGYTQQ